MKKLLQLLLPVILFAGCAPEELPEVNYLKEKIIYSSKNIIGFENLFGEALDTQEDLDKIALHNKIIGINNRNLNTFKVDIENSVNLANQIPDDCIKIAESGLSDPRIITGLKEYGFNGFLIGENFMKTDNPGEACEAFISQIR